MIIVAAMLIIIGALLVASVICRDNSEVFIPVTISSFAVVMVVCGMTADAGRAAAVRDYIEGKITIEKKAVVTTELR